MMGGANGVPPVGGRSARAQSVNPALSNRIGLKGNHFYQNILKILQKLLGDILNVLQFGMGEEIIFFRLPSNHALQLKSQLGKINKYTHR